MNVEMSFLDWEDMKTTIIDMIMTKVKEDYI